MYKVSRIVVKKTEYPEYHSYFTTLGLLATNLYNASLFRMRQNFTVRGKEHPSDLELQVQKEIQQTAAACHLGYPKRCMTYRFLEKLMRVTKNPDFFSDLPKQLAQNTVKQAYRDFKNWIAASNDQKKHPEKYLGVPKIPHYKKKGAVSGLCFTNQDCVIYQKDQKQYLKFPYFPYAYFPLGCVSGALKEVRVKPYYGDFLIVCTFETADVEELPDSQKACGIDLGVDNIVALVSNTRDCVLYKGGALKAKNQWYNKQLAYYRSIRMAGHEPKDAKRLGLLDTKRIRQLHRDRNQFFHDALHKIASDVIHFCLTRNITTIVIGKTVNWKQKCNIGHRNNQTFVQMPLATLNYFIKYKAEANGLVVVEQEESYTSKASFVDGDMIPVYGEGTDTPVFSGKRVQRGLYRTMDGTLINADLNGAANILRKAIPSSFEGTADFSFLNHILVRKYHQLNKRIPEMDSSLRE